MSEMVEVVARAISMKLYGGYPVGSNHSREIMAQWEATKEVAREAISAMRVPTQDMFDAVYAEEKRKGYCYAAYEFMDAETAWPIMIDAALSEAHETETACADSSKSQAGHRAS